MRIVEGLANPCQDLTSVYGIIGLFAQGVAEEIPTGPIMSALVASVAINGKLRSDLHDGHRILTMPRIKSYHRLIIPYQKFCWHDQPECGIGSFA